VRYSDHGRKILCRLINYIKCGVSVRSVKKSHHPSSLELSTILTMQLFIEDETRLAGGRDEVHEETRQKHLASRSRYLRWHEQHIVPCWWRKFPTWHKAFAAHATNCRASYMYRLPSEIIILISENVEGVDAFCFAMCCRPTAFLLRTRRYGPSLARQYKARVALDVLLLGLTYGDKIMTSSLIEESLQMYRPHTL